MNPTTTEELQSVLHELDLSLDIFTPFDDTISPELRDAIKDVEAFRRYLAESTY